ncbi:aldehyde dehydrogenase family protein, partial [Rhizobiaceae sp. 2RAB30]
MTIDYETLKNWSFPEVVQSYGWKDTVLYALGIGLGSDPMSRDELRFVYEPWLEALPTMAAVLAGPGFWIKDPATGEPVGTSAIAGRADVDLAVAAAARALPLWAETHADERAKLLHRAADLVEERIDAIAE